MKNMKSISATLLVSTGLLLGTALARADSITISLSSDYQFGSGGDTIEFDATVANITSNTVWLNSDSTNVDAPLTLDDSPFFNNFPLSLAASGDLGDSASGWLFTVTIPNSAPSGLYTGYFEILGGDTDSNMDPLGAADFNVAVTPEPPSWVLLATALLGLLGAAGWQFLQCGTNP